MEKKNNPISCTYGMKRSPSELFLEELFKHASVQDFDTQSADHKKLDNKLLGGNDYLGLENESPFLGVRVYVGITGIWFSPDIINGLPLVVRQHLMQPLVSTSHSRIPAKHSDFMILNPSIPAGSPTSAIKPKGRENQLDGYVGVCIGKLDFSLATLLPSNTLISSVIALRQVCLPLKKKKTSPKFNFECYGEVSRGYGFSRLVDVQSESSSSKLSPSSQSANSNISPMVSGSSK
ncbi:hypothetical protein Leryth_010483 [Lithospermum erythrorhizon]|nr:hypothetical protein Leryth_010483 [Lithospermum erythrorhizon]